MNPVFLKAAVVAYLFVAAASSADAAIVSTASNYASASNSPNIAFLVDQLGVTTSELQRSIAQTFSAETAGTVQSLSVTAVSEMNAIGLTVSLMTVVAGQPGVLLGSAPVENVIAPVEDWAKSAVQNATADFSSQEIFLAAVTSYAMVFSADSLGDRFNILGVKNIYASALGGGYANGAAGSRRVDIHPFVFSLHPVDDDIFFDVKVATIPEPSTLLMAGLLSGWATMKRCLV